MQNIIAETGYLPYIEPRLFYGVHQADCEWEFVLSPYSDLEDQELEFNYLITGLEKIKQDPETQKRLGLARCTR